MNCLWKKRKVGGHHSMQHKSKRTKKKKIDFIYLKISIKQFSKHWMGNIWIWTFDSRVWKEKKLKENDDSVTLFSTIPMGFINIFVLFVTLSFTFYKPKLMFCILISNLTNYHVEWANSKIPKTETNNF